MIIGNYDNMSLIKGSYAVTIICYNIVAFPLVGASNVGGFLCRCDPLTQTLFVFRC